MLCKNLRMSFMQEDKGRRNKTMLGENRGDAEADQTAGALGQTIPIHRGNYHPAVRLQVEGLDKGRGMCILVLHSLAREVCHEQTYHLKWLRNCYG